MSSESGSNDMMVRYQQSPRCEKFRKEIIDQRSFYEMQYRLQQNYCAPKEYIYDGSSYYDSGSNVPTGNSGNASISTRTPPRLLLNCDQGRNPTNNTCNTCSMNLNYRVENEDSNLEIIQPNTNYYGRGSEFLPSVKRQDPFSICRQNSSEAERPVTLDMNPILRSSMKKYCCNRGSNIKNNSNNSGSSGAGTPTNPTPPDSLTSDDSSYTSAKEGTTSRVRFSPITALLCESNHQREEVIRESGASENSLIGIQLRRIRKPSTGELEKDFTS